jgi:hypothetical protein
VDAAFWEAVSRLVASDDRPAPPPAHVSEALEALAFDVLLTLTSDAEAVERVSRVLGHLSARRVPALTARLVAQLEARLKVDSSSARDQVAVLCRGLRHMRLSVRAFRRCCEAARPPLTRPPSQVDTDEDARDAIQFVRSAAPLRWVPSKKKGEWHHLLCVLLTNCLSPLLGCAPVPSRRAEWLDVLAGVRAEILAWVAKSERKHLFAGYPLVAVLLSAEAALEPDAPQLRAFLDGAVSRCLRDKERVTRLAGVECLNAGLRFFGAAHGAPPPGQPGPPLWQSLAGLLAAVPGSLRRGGSAAARGEEGIAESSSLVDTCAALAMQLAPHLVLDSLVPDMLAARGGDHALNELATCGCRALLACVAVSGNAAQAPLLLPSPDGLDQALHRVRSGQQSLGVAPPPPLRACLGALVQAATGLFSPQGDSGPSSDAQAACCASLLGLVPWVVPDEWVSSGGDERMAAVLTSLALGPDAAVADAASAALRRLLACGQHVGGQHMPGMRSALLCGAVDQAVRADTDWAHERAAAAADVAHLLAADWLGNMAAVCDDDLEEDGLDGARAEAAALLLATSPDVSVRRAALRLLALLRQLHEAGACVAQDAAPAADVLEEVAPAALPAACAIAQAWPATRRRGRAAVDWAPCPSFQAALERVAGADAGRWAWALAAAAAAMARDQGRANTCQALSQIASRRAAVPPPSLMGAQAEAAPATVLDAWRASASLAAALGPLLAADGGDAPIRELAHHLVAPLTAAGAPLAVLQASFLVLQCASPPLAVQLCLDASSLRDEAVAASRVARPWRRHHELRTAAATVAAALAVGGRLGPGVALSDAATSAVVAVVEDLAGSLTAPMQAALLLGLAVQAASSSQQQQQSAAQPEVTMEEVARQRHAVAAVAAVLPPAAWPTQLRARLFALCSEWALGDILDAERAAMVARLPPKLSAPERSAADMDLAEANEAVSGRAADAAAALAGELGWEEVLRWARVALTRSAAPGPSRPELGPAARRCLLAAARAQPEMLAELVAASYEEHSSSSIRAGWHPYFRALVEGYCHHARRAVPQPRSNRVSGSTPPKAELAPAESLPPGGSLPDHAVLAAALLRLCDPDVAVRRDAVALSAAVRRWMGLQLRPSEGDEADPWPLVDDRVPPAPNTLPDVYLPTVVSLSARFAAAAPELAVPLCCEVILRVLGCTPQTVDPTAANGVLAALLPWMDTLRLDGESAHEVAPMLRALHQLCAREVFTPAAEALWSALALASRGSAAAAAAFLLEHAREEAAPGPGDSPLAFAQCAQRCALFLVRVAPAPTLNTLVASLLTRRTVSDGISVALLASAASEAPAEMQAQLPTVLHAAALAILHEQRPHPTAALVAVHGRRLLGCLIHTLTPMSGGAASVVRRLTAVTPSQPLGTVVEDILSLAQDTPQLRSDWAAEALAWCIEATGPDEAESSALVLAALACPLTQPCANALCDCIAACLSPSRAARSPASAAGFGVACLDALAASLLNTPPGKRVLYPCIFWAGVGAMRMPTLPPVNAAGARLLLAFFLGVPNPVAQGVTEDVFLMAAPSVWGLPGAAAYHSAAPFPGLAPLALRVCSTVASDDVHVAAALLCRLAALPPGGAADALYGDEDVRLPLACGAALPWLLSGGDVQGSAARDDALASIIVAATAAHGRSGAALVAAVSARDVPGVASSLAAMLTPPAAAVTATALLAVLRSGPPAWQQPAITLLAAVLGPPANARPVPELSALLAAAVGPYSSAARAALGAVLKASSKPGVKGMQQQQSMLLSALLPEQDAEAGVAHVVEALASTGVKRRDVPAFLFLVDGQANL